MTRNMAVNSICTREETARILGLICEAVLGQSVSILADTSRVENHTSPPRSGTPGLAVYLPSAVHSFPLLKLMALHQAVLLHQRNSGKQGVPESIHTVEAHLAADGFLLRLLPGLRNQMEELVEGGLPGLYPYELSEDFRGPLPWWGELPSLPVMETQSAIRTLAQRGEAQWGLSPEALESLLASLMEKGALDSSGLWQRMNDLLRQLALPSPFPEEVNEHFTSFFYPEWDSDLCQYKADWCRVRERLPKDEPNPFVPDARRRLSGLIAHTRRQFMRLKPERFRKLRGRPFGDEIDLDALVQAVVDVRSGAFFSDSVYIHRDKRLRDTAVLFLLDASISTQEKVNDHRVIDTEKEAMVLMAEALNALQDPYAIFGFQSEGRLRVDLFTIKDFAEPFGERSENRLGNLEPARQTRLGAAIRHAIQKLKGTTATTRLMIVLTDGRPYDLDYGGSDYAIEDTAKAFQEASNCNIQPFLITSDQKGADYLKRMTPGTRSIILPDVRLLPGMLPRIYKRLTI